jgi:hypothetical protein
MISPFLTTLIIAAVTSVVIALVWLVRAHLRLKRDYRVLADVVHGHNNDIADLCAAALTADGHMAATDDRISVLCAEMADYQHNVSIHTRPHPPGDTSRRIEAGGLCLPVNGEVTEKDNDVGASLSNLRNPPEGVGFRPARCFDEAAFHPYSSAIQKVRSGASVSELMQNSGLSQDEAALLIRLHGTKTPL